MKELENIIIGKSTIPALVVSLILVIAIPIVFFVFWWKKHKQETKIIYLIAGAIGFIVSARVLELGVHLICIITDNPISRFINGNTIAFVLYGITMAGVFEECGRHIVLKYIVKKNRTRENAVLYGIGHGGIEVLTVLLPLIALYLAIAVLFSAGDTEATFKILNITEETAALALPQVQAAAAFGFDMMALNVMERLFAMFLHIGLTIIVCCGVQNSNKACLPLAIVLHMLADTFPAMYQRGLMPMWAVEVWLVAWTAVIVFIAVKLYKKMK